MKMYGYITNNGQSFIASSKDGQAYEDLIEIIMNKDDCSIIEAKRCISKYYTQVELDYTEVP